MYNVIVFGSIDWNEHWQMHQQLVTSLCNYNNNVLYVDNTGVRPPSLFKDSSRIARKIREVLSSRYGFRFLNDKTTILSPFLIPHPYNRVALLLNAKLLCSKIYVWLRSSPSQRAPLIVFTFLPTPLVYRVCRKISPDILIFYCANDMSAADPRKFPLIPWEKRFFKESDHVFTTSSQLSNKALAHRSTVSEFPPGLDDKFSSAEPTSYVEPCDLALIPHPRIGYIGALGSSSGIFDLDLVIAIARSNPDLNLILIGPVYSGLSTLPDEHNVYVLGAKEHELVPSYLAFLDVALIPYRLSEFSTGVSSCKLNEYLFFGLPVVTTPFFEASRFNQSYPGLIYLANSPQEFSVAIRAALSEDGDPLLKESRYAYAISTKWSKKFSRISRLIDLSLSNKACGVVPGGHQRNILSALSLQRRTLVLFASSLVTLWLLIFASPLFPSLAYYLAPRDRLDKVDTLIVLTGDGAGEYYNQSFLNRAQDVLGIYNEHQPTRIIISTARARMVSEVEVLRAYLVDRGIPSESIFLLSPNAKSTWDHVLEIRRFGSRFAFGRLALISSPLHARRASAMLRKLSPPDAPISSPAVADTPIQPLLWWPSLKQIRVVSYELAAFLYALLIGRV